jgi:hypothetical protein
MINSVLHRSLASFVTFRPASRLAKRLPLQSITRPESRSDLIKKIMSNPTQPHLHHLAITVTDLDASVEWYESASMSIPYWTSRIPEESEESSPEATGN